MSYLSLSIRTLFTIVPALATLSSSSAQVLTEVRISTAGVDQEYIEILGTPGQSTDGLMILAVEADPAGATGSSGTLEGAYDLSGHSFDLGDPYFVFGCDAALIAFGPDTIDFATVADDLFENSSQTIYLAHVSDASVRSEILNGWLDTNIADALGTGTQIASDPRVTLLDAVGIWDGGSGDVIYDGAPVVGPDGAFMPSGALRDGGCPGDWCTDTFLDFGTSGSTPPSYASPTPGAQNPTTGCAVAASPGDCSSVAPLGGGYCAATPNSSGLIAQLAAYGDTSVANHRITLVATGLPIFMSGYFLASREQGFVANPGGSDGPLCLGGMIGRYVGPGQVQSTGPNGLFQLDLNLGSVPQPLGMVPILAGETWNFQAWFIDIGSTTGTSNFSTAVEIPFQ